LGDNIKPKVRVVLAHSLSRQYTDGKTEYVVEASRVRDILRALDDLHPGIREHLEEETAVSIDGMIYDDAYLQEVNENTEVFFIPKLDAG
jgi:sulfur-carrier protein